MINYPARDRSPGDRSRKRARSSIHAEPTRGGLGHPSPQLQRSGCPKGSPHLSTRACGESMQGLAFPQARDQAERVRSWYIRWRADSLTAVGQVGEFTLGGCSGTWWAWMSSALVWWIWRRSLSWACWGGWLRLRWQCVIERHRGRLAVRLAVVLRATGGRLREQRADGSMIELTVMEPERW